MTFISPTTKSAVLYESLRLLQTSIATIQPNFATYFVYVKTDEKLGELALFVADMFSSWSNYLMHANL